MLAGLATAVSAPLDAIISTIGSVSIIDAVYIDGQELKCACVGGSGKVPLGFASLTEHLMMVFTAAGWASTCFEGEALPCLKLPLSR